MRLFIYIGINYVRTQSGMSVSVGSSIRHVCWSLIMHVSLRPSISVSDRLSIRHVALQWGMSVLDGSPLKYDEVSDIFDKCC